MHGGCRKLESFKGIIEMPPQKYIAHPVLLGSKGKVIGKRCVPDVSTEHAHGSYDTQELKCFYTSILDERKYVC